ncbi:MAG: CRISPR-associated endonuclease Cas6 [Euryarchaeota archaeon]|nr:CRISPR-associated endonuclease Cas6 [Euryarchaeota archaeon]
MDCIVASKMRLDIGRTRDKSCTVKGVSMPGIMCEFMANFAIPVYPGLGKSVSKRFGTVVGVKR